jgi:uncharacterized delta-60 repeat protein
MSISRYLPSGETDPSFGNAGIATVQGPVSAYPQYPLVAWAFGVAVMSDGDVVVVGSIQHNGPIDAWERGAVLVRVDEDGDPDPSFGATLPGWRGTECCRTRLYDVKAYGEGMAAAGASDGFGEFWVERLEADGSSDPTFSGDGSATHRMATGSSYGPFSKTEGTELAIQDDGKILVAGGTGPASGRRAFGIARWNPDGDLDAGFGQAGATITDFIGYPYPNVMNVSGLAVDRDGRAVVAGGFLSGVLAVAQYQADQESGGDPGAGEVASAVTASGRGIRVHRRIVPKTLKKLSRNGVRVQASCPQECRLVLELRVPRSVADSMGLRGTLIGRGSVLAAAGQKRWVLAKLTARARRAIRARSGGGRMKIVIRGLAP